MSQNKERYFENKTQYRTKQELFKGYKCDVMEHMMIKRIGTISIM